MGGKNSTQKLEEFKVNAVNITLLYYFNDSILLRKQNN